MIDYIGRRLGNYQLTDLLGEGGFAQVYLGEHIYLGTQAAIKILNTQMVNDLDIFRTEARTIARLIHPNIVRVLEFGVEGNIPFLVLDYAPSGTLRRRHPDGTRVPLPLVVSYVKQVAEALQYAHDQKLIHRDVKPENMLVGRNNEVLLSDFGVALMAQTVRSQNLQNVAGTLAYIAPEQIQGKARLASDQYSLGVTVYEWLTGAPPFSGALTEVISQQLVAVPNPLRLKVPSVPLAVEQVVMRALEKDPDKRFETVRAFALALSQAAQPGGSTALPAQPSFSSSPFTGPTGLPAQPQRLAPTILPYSVPIEQPKPAGTLVASYRSHLNQVHSLSWFSDNVRIVSASSDKLVHIWDATTGSQLQVYQDISDAIRVLAASPDGSLIATAGTDTLVRVWDVITNRLIVTYRGHLGSPINALAWSPKQPLLASAATDGTVHIWDIMNGQPLTIYRGHTGSVNALAWPPDEAASPPGRGYCIVSGGDDTSVQIWEAATGRNVAFYRGQPARVLTVGWSPNIYPSAPQPGFSANLPNYSRVGCGREDGMVQMWNTTTNLSVLNYGYTVPTSAIAWSPDGRRFACVGDQNAVQVWDTTTNRQLATFSHAAPPRILAWSPNGKFVASGGSDKIIQVWVAP